MSAFVLNQEEIEKLTVAVNGMLELNQLYPGSYYVGKNAVDLLGKYAGDLHSIYRALYITNIKAVNGRYGDDTKTLPKYRPLHAKKLSDFMKFELEKAIGTFGCYLYQICEEPIYGTPIYNAMEEMNAAICAYYAHKFINWDGERE